MNTTLLIMAAGMGSRFGKGVKQFTPVGPGGELIVDYSIHDAVDAGFNKIVFIIRRELEDKFKEAIGNRIKRSLDCDITYACQELSDLPEGYSVPVERTKPWGTGQAVLAAKGLIKEPFCVINADDYYGKEAYQKIHDFLIEHYNDQGHYCMAGFILGNTLSDNGAVTRGICEVDSENHLVSVKETHGIIKTATGAEAEGGEIVDVGAHVSMNMWGFTPDYMELLENGFKKFMEKADLVSEEYLLPIHIDRVIKAGKITVEMLESKDKWFGVTYAADKKAVQDEFSKIVNAGVYEEGFIE